MFYIIAMEAAHSFMNEPVYNPLTTMSPMDATVARCTQWLLSISGVIYAAEQMSL